MPAPEQIVSQMNAFLEREEWRVPEELADLATSYAMMVILVNVMKYSIGELRPDGSSKNSSYRVIRLPRL